MSRESYLNRFGLTFHHLGLAVKRPDAAIAFLEALGYKIGEVVFDALQTVNVVMCSHESMPSIEIIFPAEGTSPIDRFLQRHKEGLVYHMCFETRDIESSLSKVKADKALQLIDVSPPTPAVLFGGDLVSFYLIEGVGLIEIISRPQS
ncbi:VOC family protein [Paraburkholderia ultramafica]|uniref:VOC family protein n=1 Tax=Paraburkholderia ultramafica TaxID=1544867 RepID=UPI0015824A4B|nr:VOC family protein [Paraburkholderia ultramafica]